MTTSITLFDDKSYPKNELLTNECVDSFIMTQIKHLPGESFQFGSTYPFGRFILLKFATDLEFSIRVESRVTTNLMMISKSW